MSGKAGALRGDGDGDGDRYRRLLVWLFQRRRLRQFDRRRFFRRRVGIVIWTSAVDEILDSLLRIVRRSRLRRSSD